MATTHGRGGRTARVLLYGFGTVGQSAAQLCARRPALEVVGVIARSADKVGRPVSDFVEGLAPSLRIAAGADAVLAGAVLAGARPDVVLHATGSLLTEVASQIEVCMRHGADVVSTSEELAYAAAQHPEVADALRGHALRCGVAVVGTGVNPGFVFDALVASFAGAAWDVSGIRVSRTLDASVFGRSVHRSLGLGYTEEEFATAVAGGSIRGHIGFPESAAMLCAVMGIDHERVEQQLEPVLATRHYDLRDWTIERGRSAGVIHRAGAWVGGRQWAEFDLRLHVDPGGVGWQVRDEIVIDGDHELRLLIDPGCSAVRTTAARLVNTVPRILRAPPGLHAVVDLAPSPPWLAPELAW